MLRCTLVIVPTLLKFSQLQVVLRQNIYLAIACVQSMFSFPSQECIHRKPSTHAVYQDPKHEYTFYLGYKLRSCTCWYNYRRTNRDHLGVVWTAKRE